MGMDMGKDMGKDMDKDMDLDMGVDFDMDVAKANAPTSGPPEDEWGLFPGGELEAPRPKALCEACRYRQPDGRKPPLCFGCYRAHLARERAIQAVLSRVISPPDEPARIAPERSDQA